MAEDGQVGGGFRGAWDGVVGEGKVLGQWHDLRCCERGGGQEGEENCCELHFLFAFLEMKWASVK